MSEDTGILDRAYAALHKCKYAEAAKDFNLLRRSGNSTASYIYGSLLATMEDFRGADEIFDELILSDSPEAKAYGMAGSARMSRLRATRMFEKCQTINQKLTPKQIREFQREFVGLKKGLEEALDEPLDCKHDVLNEYGILLGLKASIAWYHEKQEPRLFTRAINKLEEALVQDPSFTPARNNIGMTYFDWALLLPQDERKEKLALALENFNTALRMNSSYVESLINKGTVLCHLGRFSDAKEPFVAAARLNSYHTAKYVRKLGKEVMREIGIDKDCRVIK